MKKLLSFLKRFFLLYTTSIISTNFYLHLPEEQARGGLPFCPIKKTVGAPDRESLKKFTNVLHRFLVTRYNKTKSAIRSITVFNCFVQKPNRFAPSSHAPSRYARKAPVIRSKVGGPCQRERSPSAWGWLPTRRTGAMLLRCPPLPAGPLSGRNRVS